MPKLSQFALRAALGYLVLGASGALAYWVNVLVPFWPILGALSPTYLHLIVVGGLTQIIFGVMYWMFPVISRKQPRGNPILAWATFLSLNVGLLVRMIFEPWRAVDPTPFNGAMLAVSALLQWAAAILFVSVTWA